MSHKERDPLQELLRYVLVAAGMCVTVLVLIRGKWLTALVLGIWLLAVVVRFKRAANSADEH
ncbi:MAG: hypothetical protein JWN23_3306 [Rhodocyclales bacterium]|nr:hypothetical protein [Rhodocyclales bacterium]